MADEGDHIDGGGMPRDRPRPGAAAADGFGGHEGDHPGPGHPGLDGPSSEGIGSDSRDEHRADPVVPDDPDAPLPMPDDARPAPEAPVRTDPVFEALDEVFDGLDVSGQGAADPDQDDAADAVTEVRSPPRMVPRAVPPAANLDDEPTMTLGATPSPDGNAGPSSAPGGSAIDDDNTRPAGTIAGGKYRIVDRLGKGGMGVVYLARDVHLDREVAIKRISGTELGDEESVQRFMREARAIARLSHANIVSIFTLERDESGPFIVMEHIKGRDAGALVADQGPLELDEALKIVRGVGQALAFAHRNAIFHRDVKPSNILIDEEGTPKLVDFGLAKMGRDSALSQTGMGMGTLTYVAPEQLDDASSVDQRADIYSLAKTAYHLMTGERPDAPDLDRMPDELRAPLRKAMQSKPENRHFAVTELLDELDAGSKTFMRTAGPGGSSAMLRSASQMFAQVACPSCRVNNPMTARFCRACGTGLRTPCPRCSHQEVAGAQHCSSCGLSFEGSAKGVQLLESAREKLEEGLFRAAIEDADRGIPMGHQAEPLRAIRTQAARLLDQLESTVEPARAATAANEHERAFNIIRDAHAHATGPLKAALAHELDAAARSRDDADVRLAMQQAAALEKQGRLFEAIAALRRANRVRPDDTALGSRLSALQKVHRERVLQAIRERTAAFLQNKEYEPAITGIDTAIERVDDDAIVAELQKMRRRVTNTIINTRLASARHAEQCLDPDTVRTHARGVLGIEPQHREAKRLLSAADELETAARILEGTARELLDAARPGAARTLIADSVPGSPTSGPLAAIHAEIVQRLASAGGHAREAQRLIESKLFREAAAEAEASLALDRDNPEVEALRDAAVEQAASRRRRRTVLAGGIAVATIAGLAGGWIGGQAYARTSLAQVEALIEDGKLAEASAQLDAIPEFVAPRAIGEARGRIASIGVDTAAQALTRSLRRLESDADAGALGAALEAARRVSAAPDADRLAAVERALDRAAIAASRAGLDTAALLDEVGRFVPEPVEFRAGVALRLTRAALDDAATAPTPAARSTALNRAITSAGATNDPDTIATARASVITEARTRAAQLGDAITRGDGPSADTAMTALRLLADGYATTLRQDDPRDPLLVRPLLAAAESFVLAATERSKVRDALAAELAPDQREQAVAQWDAGLAMARDGGWAEVAGLFEEAATLFAVASAEADDELVRRQNAISALIDRRALRAADADLAPLLAIDPDNSNLTDLADRLDERRVKRIALAEGVELELVSVEPLLTDDVISADQVGFYLGRTEVTEAQYAAVMGEPIVGDGRLPRTGVTYADALRFAAEVERRINTRGRFRLPTRREFRLACAELGENREGAGWHAGNARGRQPVASRTADALGLHDLVGNVAEWLWDGDNPAAAFPTAAGGGTNKGSSACSCLEEEEKPGGAKGDVIGFRLLWQPPAVVPSDAP